MVGAGWNDLASEISRWRGAGRPIEFWWRDDDATQPTSALERLLRLAMQFKVPLALAVIPAQADLALFALLPAEADVLQHGADHSNRAAPGDKKTEYPADEAMDTALARLADGRQRLSDLAGARSLGVESNCRVSSAAPCVLRVSGAEPLRCTRQCAGGRRSHADQHSRGHRRLEGKPRIRRRGAGAFSGYPPPRCAAPRRRGCGRADRMADPPRVPRRGGLGVPRRPVRSSAVRAGRALEECT